MLKLKFNWKRTQSLVFYTSIYVTVTLLRESSIVLVLCFTCKICLQHFRYNDKTNKWTQMFTSTLHYFINILNLYMYCVFRYHVKFDYQAIMLYWKLKYACSLSLHLGLSVRQSYVHGISATLQISWNILTIFIKTLKQKM